MNSKTHGKIALQVGPLLPLLLAAAFLLLSYSTFFLLFTSPLSNRKWFFVVKARPGMTEFHPEFKLLTFNNQKSVSFFQ